MRSDFIGAEERRPRAGGVRDRARGGRAWAGWLGAACLLGLLVGVGAETGRAANPLPAPTLYLIERFLTNMVLVHFDTDPDREYTLQYLAGTNLTGGGSWSNLFVAEPLPWPNHYIIPDMRTNAVRIYRLKAVP